MSSRPSDSPAPHDSPRVAHAIGRIAGTATRLATRRDQRRETLVIIGSLVGDLLSIPFHVLIFLFTRARHRREFQRALKEAAP